MEKETTENKLLNYFNQDQMAADVWKSKYALKGEETPDDMHRRMAKEFARVQKPIPVDADVLNNVSRYGFNREMLTEESIYNLFKDFKYIVPQGSIMSMLGNYKVGSLSNCFVIGQPHDSYGGIMYKDQEMAQLMKRRGGVGLDISTLAPKGREVNNAAGSSTGAVSFMGRYSNTTREVAQNGRRGALMLTIDVRHPDVMDFVNIKKDRTQVTGANISVMLRDDFMEAVKEDRDYVLRFPCDTELGKDDLYYANGFPDADQMEYNKTYHIDGDKFVKVIRAKELYKSIVENAWDNAEPGQMFVDRHWSYSPDGVYPQYKGVTTNPCFHPDTFIETVKGRVKIKDITEETYVYSMSKDGKLCVRKASAAFKTKLNTQTVKITLRNGNTLKVTPDHKVFVHDKGWVEAQNLIKNDRIVHQLKARRGVKYVGTKLTSQGNREYKMEHRLAYEGVNGNTSHDIHHVDGNTFNNTINNLEAITHDSHARLTATTQNPQNHQVRDSLGKFITHEGSRKGAKTAVNLPDDIKTGFKSRWDNCVVSVVKSDITDVYDIQVEDTHCLIANGMVAHNCGEIFMQAYDACRLMALNLFSFVKNPFTQNAELDTDLLYKTVYEQQVLADSLVDLELEHISRILKKIENDPEPDYVKQVEKDLWTKIYNTAKASRRTGSGFTALGDTLAALGHGYDSSEGKNTIEQIMKIKMEAELDATIDLAIQFGTFEGWNPKLEYKWCEENGMFDSYFDGTNDFYRFIEREFPTHSTKLRKFGRRNVSWSTVAPTGTVSLMTQTTSGLEPLFSGFYMRRKKVNPNDDNVRVDFTDQNGDTWMEYPVLHPKFKEWMDKTWDFNNVMFDQLSKDNVQIAFESSPWYKSTANDIDWIERVEIQNIIQKYTTHSISSTINLPNEATQEEVADIYMAAYDKGLKGVTIYRDGCRTGVLVTDNKKKDEFVSHDAPKRPKDLPAESYVTSVKGEKFNVLVGLLDGKPYEIFAFPFIGNIGKYGDITKEKKGTYSFFSDDKYTVTEKLTSNMSDEQAALTRLISTSLRHGADIMFVVEQLNKADGDITSYTKAVARILKKYVDEEKMISRASCQDCGSTNIIMQEGCLTCRDCGNSKCG